MTLKQHRLYCFFILSSLLSSLYWISWILHHHIYNWKLKSKSSTRVHIPRCSFPSKMMENEWSNDGKKKKVNTYCNSGQPLLVDASQVPLDRSLWADQILVSSQDSVEWYVLGFHKYSGHWPELQSVQYCNRWRWDMNMKSYDILYTRMVFSTNEFINL